ncbi:TPA: ATP-binding cassette domain-containing protein, partial [Candidatus Poribacteria bacterium]|nr:ATP-binding cassette domain-containing protein [Candidatus Poribacteria bacterium]
IFQNPDHQIFANTVREEVSFSPRNYGFSEAEVRSSVEEALRAVELEGYEEMSPFLLTKGERQRVALASVLACKPRVIILDEPTTGLDYHQQRRIMELLRRLNEEGHTIIIVTHSLWGVAEYAHRIILLRKGRLVADGPVREVFADEGRLRKAGLKPPKIVELGGMFGTILLSVEELKSCLRRRRTDEVGLPLP